MTVSLPHMYQRAKATTVSNRHAEQHQHTRPHWCGGRRRDRRARAAVPVGGGGARPRCWSAAGPGRASHSDLAPLVWRAPEGPEGLAARPVGGGGARLRCWSAAAGPGRASRSTTPSEARVWRSRGRAAADQHTQQPAPRHAETPPRGCGTGFSLPSRV